MKPSVSKSLLFTTIIGALSFSEVPEASAAGYYCNWIVDAHTWCWGAHYDGVYRNRNRYPGGSLRVGIQFYRNFTGGYHHRYFSTSGFIAYDWGYVMNGQPLVANGSDHRHTMEGYFSNCPSCSNAREAPFDLRATRPVSGVLGVLATDAPVPVMSSRVFKAAVDADYGVDLTAARLAFVGERGEQFVVAPGARACLFGDSEATTMTTCATADQIEQGDALVMGDLLDDLDAGHVRVSGMAPDGVTAVRIQLVADGPAHELPVTNNVFTADLPGTADAAPAAVTFVRANEPNETETEPLEVDTGGCRASDSSGGAWAMLLGLAAMLVGRRKRRVVVAG